MRSFLEFLYLSFLGGLGLSDGLGWEGFLVVVGAGGLIAFLYFLLTIRRLHIFIDRD
jgi:hypothetical protein